MENKENISDYENLIVDVVALNCSVDSTLRNVISISSNLSNDLDSIVLGRRSEPSLLVGNASANLLVDLKKTSVDLLRNSENYESSGNLESKEDLILDVGPAHQTVEYLNTIIKERDEFNKCMKNIILGLQKMSKNARINNDDSRRHSPNSTTSSDDFDINNLHLATSSPM